jgi:hypothetical protein
MPTFLCREVTQISVAVRCCHRAVSGLPTTGESVVKSSSTAFTHCVFCVLLHLGTIEAQNWKPGMREIPYSFRMIPRGLLQA